MKDLIKGTIADLVTKFLYYDRKEDEQLSKDALYNAIETGVITVDEMVEKFREELEEGLK